MPKAILTITVPEDMWIATISQAHPIRELRVLSAIPSGATGVSVAELTTDHPEPDVESLVEEIRSVDTIVAVDVLGAEENRLLLQLETQYPALLNAARESGVPISMPFSIRDGTATWEVTASREKLSELGEQLETFDIRFTVESIYQRIDSERFLTDHQWTVLRTAIERGYYDTPRTCTQYELAETLGVAKSTCSETLHRAEERVIKQFLDAVEEPSAPMLAPTV